MKWLLPACPSRDFWSVIVLKFMLLNFHEKSVNISTSANEDSASNSLMTVIMTGQLVRWLHDDERHYCALIKASQSQPVELINTIKEKRVRACLLVYIKRRHACIMWHVMQVHSQDNVS